MSLHSTLATILTLSGSVPTLTLLQTTPEPAGIGDGLAVFLVLGILMYVVYVVFSIVVGAIILLVSEFVCSDSYVASIERHIYDQPLRSGAIGFGALIGGFVGIILLMIVLLLLMELGVPEPAVLLSMIPFFAGMIFIYVGATVGTIVVGAYLLRRLRGGTPNFWIALVVGALIVNLPGLNFALAFVVLFVGTGAMVDHWWQNRRSDTSESNPPGVVES